MQQRMSTQTKSPKKQNAGQFLEQKVLFHTNRAIKIRLKQFVKCNVLKNDL